MSLVTGSDRLANYPMIPRRVPSSMQAFSKQQPGSTGRVTTAYDSSRDHVREVKLRRGILLARSALQETRTYTVRNVDLKAKTLLNVKPAESTATHSGELCAEQGSERECAQAT